VTGRLGSVLILVATAAACAPLGTGGEAAAPIAGLWRSRCGACHVPVEPGSRSQEVLREALRRHRKRLRLTDAQWSDLGAWLAQR
jgi:hypothetical protein